MGNDKVSDGTAYTIMRDWVKWENPRNKLFIVHRLDRDTSGLMMMAKNENAKEAMQHNWNNMVISRKYVCVVEGYVEKTRARYAAISLKTASMRCTLPKIPMRASSPSHVTRW